MEHSPKVIVQNILLKRLYLFHIQFAFRFYNLKKLPYFHIDFSFVNSDLTEEKTALMEGYILAAMYRYIFTIKRCSIYNLRTWINGKELEEENNL